MSRRVQDLKPRLDVLLAGFGPCNLGSDFTPRKCDLHFLANFETAKLVQHPESVATDLDQRSEQRQFLEPTDIDRLSKTNEVSRLSATIFSAPWFV